KKLLLFIALFTASIVNAKVAFLVPAANTNEDSMQFEEVDGNEQSPERRAWRWFRDNFVTPGNGQFICFNDLSDIPSDINAIWIYIDRVGLDAATFDALFADYLDELQGFVNAGGNLFLCKQATRLEKDLVGAKKSNNDVIVPDYNYGGYRDAATWGVDFKFFLEEGWGSNLGHKMFVNTRHHNSSYAELIWTNGGKLTDNNCGIGTVAMEMGDVYDRNNLAAFQTRNNCKVLGAWANDGDECNNVNNEGCYNGCHYGGIIEFYPAGARKGTVIMIGLASYSWINNNGGWGFENTEDITRGALEYLSAAPGLAWNEETVPESGVINSTHIMTAHANAGFNIAYTADEPTIANIGIGDGNIYYNYFGDATFEATATGDGWTAAKNLSATIETTVSVNGGNQAVKFAYVLPYSMHVMANYDNEDGRRPDFEAAAWFYNQFIVGEVGGQHGCFVRPSDIGSLDEHIKVLWIHNDHVDKASADYYADLGGDTFRDNLAAFVNAGGNVFVSKQATRLIGDLGRNGYPSYANGGYGDGDKPEWRVGNRFELKDGDNNVVIDHSSHAVYANMGTNTTIMAAGRHTDNNCIWQNFAAYGDEDVQRLYHYQDDHNCRILGGWGHNAKLECAGMVEYYPQTAGQGTIIAMGLAAYHWANPTDLLKNFTRDILYYLNIDEAPGFAWVQEPQNGCVGFDQIAQVEHKDSELQWTSSNTDVVEIVDDPAHPSDKNYKKLILKAVGDATITATRTGDGYKLPKNVTGTTSVTKTIHVVNGYSRSELEVGNYYTICLPKAAESYSGAMMFALVDKDASNNITIEEVEEMTAGTPYIFRATATTLNVTYTGDIEEAKSVNGLVGHIGASALELESNANYYILAQNKIWQVDETVSIPSNRAYIDMSQINPVAPAPGRMRHVIQAQNVATGMEQTNSNPATMTYKCIRDGQLLIMRDAHIYNAQGQMIR
ncbi:MAG: DUF4960 domain-containing protein, partial [Paludibacteraceae bacterium]|nr:DUF4960 domain-containing protein [Paludibacteraceae bacterium]